MAELDQQALEEHNPFQGPVPGQSLTNSPDDQQPWEQPPKMTSIKEATERMFLEILKKENLEALLTLMNNGMSIGKITEMLLFIGFTKGEFNADLMMLLAEPTMYMLLAIAEAVGINPILDEDDHIITDEDIDEEDERDIDRLNEKIGPLLRNPKQLRKLAELQDSLEVDAIPQEIQERVEAVDFSAIKESLLARPSREENTNDSLLERK